MDSGHLVRGTTSTIREVPPANSFEFGPTGPPLQPWLPPQESALPRILPRSHQAQVDRSRAASSPFSAIVAVASFKMTPIYEAVGSIAINKPDPNLVNFKDSQNGGGDFSDSHRHSIPRLRSCRATCWRCR